MAQWLLFIHVFAAIWFAGGMVAFSLIHWRLRSLKTLTERIVHLRLSLYLTKIAIVPGGLTSAIVGILLAIVMGYNILQTVWLILSLMLFVYATLMGILFLTPSDRYALRVSEEELAKGLPGEQSRKLLHRPQVNVLRVVNLVAVLLLIALMILRPYLVIRF